MTDMERHDVLAKNPEPFAQSLASFFRKNGRWTPKQQFWVAKITQPKPAGLPIVEGFDGTKVLEMFDEAAKHLKRPAITFVGDPNGPTKKIKISRCASGENEGCLNLSNAGAYGTPENVWFGRINRKGEWETTGKAHPRAVAFLTAFAAAPRETAEKYGKRTGFCCFCNRPLKDERSTNVGYGPVCADHFAMPWGNK